LHALVAYRGQQVTAEELAERACTIEIERCGKPIGKQDQYIAALGGIRDIRFGPGDDVIAEELGLSAPERRALQQQIMLFYTGVTRSADPILAEQNANVETTRPQLDILRDLAGFAVERLLSGGVDAIGPTVRESWEAKRKLASGVSNDRIDQAITRALDAGASGAKLTGAGGGGFLLVICPIERQRVVRERLAGMRELPGKLGRVGSRIVRYVLRGIWGQHASQPVVTRVDAGCRCCQRPAQTGPCKPRFASRPPSCTCRHPRCRQSSRPSSPGSHRCPGSRRRTSTGHCRHCLTNDCPGRR